MYEQKGDRKPKKKPETNSGAEKYNNWNKKFTRGIKGLIWVGRRKKQWPWRYDNENLESEKQKEKRL